MVKQHWGAYENLNLIWLFPGHLLAGLWLLTDPHSPSPLLPGDRVFRFCPFWSCSSLVAAEISSFHFPADRHRRLAMRA
jgi:hypothetical protein